MGLRVVFSVSLLFIFHLSLCTPLHSQETAIKPLSSWLATVDEPSQQIVLSWGHGEDERTYGYYICSGTPCYDYDTVFGRYDTTYRCIDHQATERHLYRLHVFDSLKRASSLTPAFGNIVLTAEVPRCSTSVNVSWTPYVGMPGGVRRYQLLVRLEPYDDGYTVYYTADSTGPCSCSFDIVESVTRVWLKVQAMGIDSSGHLLVSQSNIVSVERLTVDTVSFLDILSVEYDSIRTRNLLTFDIDTAYHASPYTLLRSIDGTPWDSIATLSFDQPPFTYADNNVNPYDSLHCYQLSVLDACGLNPRYSSTQCVVVPTPPPPASAIPNVIIVGSADNGTFLPRLRGLKGDLYELHIYNRLGLLVHHSTDPASGWTPVASTPQGVYTYALRCRFNNNQIKDFVGTVTVIK